MSKFFLGNLMGQMQKGIINKHCYLLVAAMTLPEALLPGRAEAQFNIVSESRSDGGTTSGPYGTPGFANSSSAMAGVFNHSDSAATFGGNGSFGDNVGAQGSQNSSISSIGFQGTGSTNTVMNLVANFNDSSARANAFSTFSVNFTVATPEPFVFSGDLTADVTPLRGGTTVGSAELSSTGQPNPLYQITLNDNPNLGQNLSTPLSFSTILQPGQTYTLALSANTTDGASTLAYNENTSAGFDFSAAVPEPASLSILLLAGPLLLRRRRIA